jgi:pantoate--beta-alanine ligase
MLVVKTVSELQIKLNAFKAASQSIGFVPTMGALHNGHLSLVQEAGRQCDVVVVSIFVNPNQFNNSEDLARYPRVLQDDLEMLADVTCDLVFAPSVEEVYPEPDMRVFDFGVLEQVMEGKFRPGHFNGVAQVVSRLFDLVKPQKAFFGLKDFQQLAIISAMVKQLELDVEIVPCPILRETDGLAMSSRNTLLNAQQRKNAPLIGRTLIESLNFVPHKSVSEIEKWVIDTINKDTELEVEYFEIVNGITLQKVDNWGSSDYIVGCIAVFAGKIRLIDNIIYQKPSS